AMTACCTAVAPSSRRERSLEGLTYDSYQVCPATTRSGVDGVGDVVEDGAEVLAEERHGGDDNDGDERHHQAVLHRCRAAVGVTPRLELGKELGHVGIHLPGLSRIAVRINCDREKHARWVSLQHGSSALTAHS